MPVGEVGVAHRCAVATVPEQSADQGQVLAGHDGLTGGGVPKVVQALPAELGVRTDRAPADNKAVRIPAFSASFGNRNAPERRFPGSASMIARAALPSGTARGPVLESAKLIASAPMSRHRSCITSPRRHPVSASNRIAATASGHSASRASSARPSRASSSVSRNRAMLRLGRALVAVALPAPGARAIGSLCPPRACRGRGPEADAGR